MLRFVMLSHASRAETLRPQSLAQLATAGITPAVIESTATSNPDAEVRRKAYDALAMSGPSGLVFLEDDILVNARRFGRHVHMAVKAAAITAFCAVNRRHYPIGLLEQPALRLALHPIPEYDADRGFHGSMAVYVPPAVCRYAVDHPGQFMQPNGERLTRPVIPPGFKRGKVTGFDFWLKHAARDFGGMLVAVPNSVDHVGATVGTSRAAAWRSPTFNTPEAP